MENDNLRINRYLALCGLGSRRECESLIREGRISANGEIIQDLSYRVHNDDLICCDGKDVKKANARQVYCFHKPAGYLCSRRDPFGRATIYDILPPELQSFHYVGRLDLETRGLLLLTNDGELSQRLTHPDYALTRCYRVWLNHSLSEKAAEELESGIELADGTSYRPVRLSGTGRSFDLELREGKKREIREMMRHFGLRVLDLFRFEYGGIWLDNLAEGQWRELENEELQGLLSLVRMAAQS